MNNLSLIVDNQNLKRMVEFLLEDITSHCVDCENRLPYALRYVPENPTLAHMAERCKQCVFGKYRKPKHDVCV